MRGLTPVSVCGRGAFRELGVGFAARLWYVYIMRVIVVTGGLGSGKSTASEFFRAKGAVVVDLDQVAATLLAPGSSLLKRVVGEFGEGILLDDGRLDRAALGEAAFASREAAQRLNAIVHPAVANDIATAIEQLLLLPDQPIAVILQVPLLVEAPVICELADTVLAISAPESVRIARAVAGGMSLEDATRRVGLQATDAERAELADVIMVNGGSIADLVGELDAFWAEHVAVGGGPG